MYQPPVIQPPGGGGVSLSAANVWTGIPQTVSGASGSGPDWEASITGDTFARVAIGINTSDVARVSFGPGNAVRDVFLERAGVGALRHGAPDAAAPVAQTLSVQNVIAGTSNTAGVDWTFKGSQGTGTGAGGGFTFQVAPAGSTGTAQNALANALTIASTKAVAIPQSLAIGGATIGSNALAVTGTVNVSSDVTSGGNVQASTQVLVTAGSGAARMNSLGFKAASLAAIGFAQTNDSNDTLDVVLRRDAANTLAQRNGANAQTHRVYNTFTDASNGEWGTYNWADTANVLTIGTKMNGTGVARAVQFVVGGTQIANFATNGNLLWNTDNTYDIGSSAATRPRSIYAGTSIIGLNNLVTPTGFLGNSLRGGFRFPSDGVFTLLNTAETDFGRLQFGGTTSSFPALKRSATILQARLADDSGDAFMQGKLRTVANAVAETITPDHTIVLYDAAGTAYRVPCQV